MIQQTDKKTPAQNRQLNRFFLTLYKSSLSRQDHAAAMHIFSFFRCWMILSFLVQSIALNNCTYEENADYAPSTWSFGTVLAATPSDCCDACSEIESCIVAPFFNGVCYLKSVADMVGGKYYKESVTSCKPARKD